MALLTVGTVTCPECGTVQRVFRRGFIDPRTRLPIYAISLHFRGPAYCKGMGRRVKLSEVTR